MPEPIGRAQGRLAPAVAWTALTEAPLKGLSLAREAGRILAWDQRDQLYMFDLKGDLCAQARAPARVTAAAASDDGTLVAMIGEGGRLWLLDPNLEMLVDRQTPPDPSAICVDPHGRYVVVATRLGLVQFYTRHGKPAGKFEPRQPLAHLVFVPDRPMLVAASTYGLLTAVELVPAGGPGKLEASTLWEEALLSNVGRLTVNGDGGMILASCFNLGVQRFDTLGHNEGAYHLGGTTAHAVPDFPGRVIAVSTLENELIILGSSGSVHWKTELPRPAIALEVDGLGRYLIYGLATGEIVRVDLAPAAAGSAASPRSGSTALRQPAWSIPLSVSDEQAASSVLTVLANPPRIGLVTSNNKLQVFTTDGKHLGLAPELLGVGRYLRTAPGWIAVGTDRQFLLYDARRNAAQKLDLSLVEVTHASVQPDTYGIAIVQERDRLGRATLAGRWVWKKTFPVPIEDLVIGREGTTALTTHDGVFRLLDLAGELAAEFGREGDEPLSLVEAPDGSPPLVAWLTLARRAQRLRGHDHQARVVWEVAAPWEGWQFLRVGSVAVVVSADGRAAAYDGTGRLVTQSRTPGPLSDVFGSSSSGAPLRVSSQDVHVICSDLSGRVKWRAVSEAAIGPIAIGAPGVAVVLGRTLNWFPADDS